MRPVTISVRGVIHALAGILAIAAYATGCIYAITWMASGHDDRFKDGVTLAIILTAPSITGAGRACMRIYERNPSITIGRKKPKLPKAKVVA